MKKIINLLSILFIAGTSFAQTITPSTSENYTVTKTYIAKDGDTIQKPPITTISYFDGLGRPKQNINVKATPSGKDVVTHVEYDSYGRQTKEYLPIPQTGTQNGAIYTSPLANASFYGNEKIYSEKVLENSPLDRIKQQIQVGNDWASKPLNFLYETNIATEVRAIRIQSLQLVGEPEQPFLAKGGFYGAGTLLKNTVIDEDGGKIVEFRDRTGKIVLIRKVLSATENEDTHYIYNDHKQLVYVTSPLASKKIGALPGPTVTQVPADIINDLCYQYKYDGKNRLIEKKLPGKGWEYMLYDKQDRLVGTQDTILKEKGQWFYTKYDKLGRIAITGISTGGERSVEQAEIDGLGSNNVNRINYVFFNRQGMDVYYDNPDSSYPNSTKWVTLLSLNYYDSYPAYSFNPFFPTSILGQPVLTDNSTGSIVSTNNLPLIALVKNVEDDNWTKNYTYYDSKGRVIGTHSLNHLGGYTKTESEIDFGGAAKQVKTYHKRLNTETERVITETFEYDAQNRIKKHWHQVDSQPQELLAENIYNEISQLSNKKVGNNLQSIDYTYNIKGWLTKINDPTNLNGKLFGYEIKYTNPTSTSLVTGKFNGNIAEVDWKTANDEVLKRYSYTYDIQNKLKTGYYQEPLTAVPFNNFFNEEISYDLNGNITNLQRNTRGPSSTAEAIDNLTYTYLGNKLISAADASQNYDGYPVGGNTIGYDNNGNMTNLMDKGIESIKYNFLNLPNEILTTNAVLIEPYKIYYTYRSDGAKVRKKHIVTKMDFMGGFEIVETLTDYLDGFQYSPYMSCSFCSPTPSRLQFVPTSEGYYDFENNKYIYNYVDHLGNIRLSYKNNGSGGAQIVEENNYYPFGLKHGRIGFGDNGKSYKYKYNGKELQETGMYDYGARFYMPDLGRWGVADPLAEIYYSHSPYNYVGNNPIIRIDPFGMDWYTDKNGNYKYDPNLTKDNAEKFFKDNKIEGGKYFGESGNVEVFTKDSDGRKIKTLSNHSLNKDGSVMDLLTGNKLDGGTSFETEMDFSINAFDDKPNPYNYATGEQFKSNDGNTYQIQFGEWVKLSGVTVNYDAYRSISSLGYTPSSNPIYGDAALMRKGANKTLNDAIDPEGFISGTIMEGIVNRKISAPDPRILLIGAIYNMYKGIYEQTKSDMERDEGIKSGRK